MCLKVIPMVLFQLACCLVAVCVDGGGSKNRCAWVSFAFVSEQGPRKYIRTIPRLNDSVFIVKRLKSFGINLSFRL